MVSSGGTSIIAFFHFCLFVCFALLCFVLFWGEGGREEKFIRVQKSKMHTKICNVYTVVCHKLVLKSVSYPKIVKNTPILIEQSIACNVYT